MKNLLMAQIMGCRVRECGRLAIRWPSVSVLRDFYMFRPAIRRERGAAAPLDRGQTDRYATCAVLLYLISDVATHSGG